MELYNTISSKLYRNFIKYDKLKSLTLECFEDSNSNNLNVYININSILLELYNEGVVDYEFSITSGLINLCSHIRAYYSSRHSVNTKIFLVYSTMECTASRIFVPGYNSYNDQKKMSNRIISKTIFNNINILKEMCKYIPNVYMVVKSAEPAVVILDLIYKEESKGNTAPNVVYTKDMFDYQLPAIHNNTIIFRPKRYKGEDISYSITKWNVVKQFINDSKAKFNFDTIELHSEYLSVLMTLSNLTCRSLGRQFILNTAYAILLNTIKNDTISLFNLEDLHSKIYKYNKMLMPLTLFTNRFKGIDLNYQFNIYLQSPESKDISHDIDLDNPELIQKINNEIFKDNPIDLNRL